MNEHLGAAFDNMLEGCQIISPQYTYLYVNKAVAAQGKNTKANLTGNKMTELYPGIDQTPMFQHLRACMEERKVQRFDNEFTFPDGSSGWFELRMEPIPEGVLLLSLDITDRKRAELQRQDLDELKNTFIELVSHQLGTPLTTVRWALENMIAGKSTDHAKDLEAIHAATLEIITRLNDMIATLSIAEGKASLKKERASLQETIGPVLEDLKKRAAQQRIRIHVQNDTPDTQVLWDIAKIRMALSKIVDNALLYTPDSGSIDLTISGSPGRIKFAITDTGIGIPQNDQKHVFTRFFRAPNARLLITKASGVGLTIAKYYIEQHGGSIGFSSVENEGSSFWFELPA